MRKSVGHRPHDNGLRAPETAGKTSESYSPPHLGQTREHPGWGRRPAKLSWEPFPHQANGVWGHTPVGPLLKGSPAGEMPTPSSEAQLRGTEGCREEARSLNYVLT